MNQHLYIKAGFKNQKTFLEKTFYRQPLKIANITEDKNGSLLRLMIMSSSPGVLDKDDYSLEIDVGENASVHITTQGYQRLFTMSNQASQQTNVRIHNNGSLYFLPHPIVPHAASCFSSVNNIHLVPNHNLVWSEIITCGRKLSGEEFEFTKLHSLTNVYLENKLVVRENVLLEPLKSNIHALGQLEGYTHQSTLLFINDYIDLEQISLMCSNLLSKAGGITFGISRLPVKGLICRILGHKGEQLFYYTQQLAQVIYQSVNTSLQQHTDAMLTS